ASGRRGTTKSPTTARTSTYAATWTSTSWSAAPASPSSTCTAGRSSSRRRRRQRSSSARPTSPPLSPCRSIIRPERSDS
ncbi:hypothetical protein LTR57_020670, partial [Friedmanniomyces endolithicus]